MFEAEVVADLHAALGRYPHDPMLLDLIADLRAANERFAQLWNARPVAVKVLGLHDPSAQDNYGTPAGSRPRSA